MLQIEIDRTNNEILRSINEREENMPISSDPSRIRSNNDIARDQGISNESCINLILIEKHKDVN